MDSWIILIPTILTIVVCLLTKKIFVGMFVGIFSACMILAGGNPLSAIDMSFSKLIGVVSSSWNTKIILFAILIGGMIKLMQVSGGVHGLIEWLQKKAKVNTKGKAQFLTWLIGVILFFDQYTSEAVTATIGKTLSRNYGYSREKVAYLVDSTASPMCAFLPLNSWGAYIIGLLASLGVANTMGVMVKALPFNFYCIFALIISLIVALKGWNLGSMKAVEAAYDPAKDIDNVKAGEDEKTASPWMVILPIIVIIICVIGGQFISGHGVFSDGDTSNSVFYAMLIGNIVTILLAMKNGMKYQESVKACGEGIFEMVPIGMLLVFAFCLSSLCSELGVGGYISAITAAHLPNLIVPMLVFITASLMAFATGSSWGTFAIMIPIVVPMSEASVIPVHILVAAMLSGAIMGDHCSMISDSTVMASAFSGCDNVSHFRTQLPYALISAGIACVLYLVVGIFI
ncbi:MAG: hypothetical protein K5774_06030 [Clostridia bacterium]|nr:hypothetical protein [Clostridia bacterium]